LCLFKRKRDEESEFGSAHSVITSKIRNSLTRSGGVPSKPRVPNGDLIEAKKRRHYTLVPQHLSKRTRIASTPREGRVKIAQRREKPRE